MPETKPKFGPEHYPEGTIIIQQGDEPEKFYIITRGRVEIVMQPPDGLDEVIDEIGPGDYFGEVGMVQRRRRMATVRAQTAVDLMAMDYQTFMNWMNSAPEVADEIDAVIEERLLNQNEDQPVPVHMPLDLLAESGQDGGGEDETAVPPTVQYPKDTLIIRQGDLADKFYVIIEGFVRISRNLPDGTERTINHLTIGDYFGEIGLLDGSPRIANVTAVTPVKLLSFDRDIFKEWMRKSPSSQEDLQREADRRRIDTGMLSLPEGS